MSFHRGSLLTHLIVPGIALTVIVLATAASGRAGEESDEENTLLTDSFEVGTKAPEGWIQGASIPGVTYAWDQKQASDGERSLSFRKTANRYFPIAAWSRKIARTGDKPAVKVTAQVKASKASKAVVDVLFLDGEGEWVKHQWAAFIGQKGPQDPLAHHDWKPYSGVVEIPPNTSHIVVGLQMYGPGEVWFDELEVAYVDALPETP